jgi:hypothetical protein
VPVELLYHECEGRLHQRYGGVAVRADDGNEGHNANWGNQRSAIPVPHEARGTVVPAWSKEQAQLPFVMDLKRGRMTRVEIEFKGQTVIQGYNGMQGWRLRLFSIATRTRSRGQRHGRGRGLLFGLLDSRRGAYDNTAKCQHNFFVFRE